MESEFRGTKSRTPPISWNFEASLQQLNTERTLFTFLELRKLVPFPPPEFNISASHLEASNPLVSEREKREFQLASDSASRGVSPP